MHDADGTGLAAPQVHMPWRILVYFVDGGRAAGEDGDGEGADGGVPLTVMVNPVVELPGRGDQCRFRGLSLGSRHGRSGSPP